MTARSLASLSRSDCSCRLRSVMSVMLPTMRSARPSDERSTTRPRDSTHFQSPVNVRSRYSAS